MLLSSFSTLNLKAIPMLREEGSAEKRANETGRESLSSSSSGRTHQNDRAEVSLSEKENDFPSLADFASAASQHEQAIYEGTTPNRFVINLTDSVYSIAPGYQKQNNIKGAETENMNVFNFFIKALEKELKRHKIDAPAESFFPTGYNPSDDLTVEKIIESVDSLNLRIQEEEKQKRSSNTNRLFLFPIQKGSQESIAHKEAESGEKSYQIKFARKKLKEIQSRVLQQINKSTLSAVTTLIRKPLNITHYLRLYWLNGSEEMPEKIKEPVQDEVMQYRDSFFTEVDQLFKQLEESEQKFREASDHYSEEERAYHIAEQDHNERVAKLQRELQGIEALAKKGIHGIKKVGKLLGEQEKIAILPNDKSIEQGAKIATDVTPQAVGFDLKLQKWKLDQARLKKEQAQESLAQLKKQMPEEETKAFARYKEEIKTFFTETVAKKGLSPLDLIEPRLLETAQKRISEAQTEVESKTKKLAEIKQQIEKIKAAKREKFADSHTKKSAPTRIKASSPGITPEEAERQMADYSEQDELSTLSAEEIEAEWKLHFAKRNAAHIEHRENTLLKIEQEVRTLVLEERKRGLTQISTTQSSTPSQDLSGSIPITSSLATSPLYLSFDQGSVAPFQPPKPNLAQHLTRQLLMNTAPAAEESNILERKESGDTKKLLPDLEGDVGSPIGSKPSQLQEVTLLELEQTVDQIKKKLHDAKKLGEPQQSQSETAELLWANALLKTKRKEIEIDVVTPFLDREKSYLELITAWEEVAQRYQLLNNKSYGKKLQQARDYQSFYRKKLLLIAQDHLERARLKEQSVRKAIEELTKNNDSYDDAPAGDREDSYLQESGLWFPIHEHNEADFFRTVEDLSHFSHPLSQILSQDHFDYQDEEQNDFGYARPIPIQLPIVTPLGQRRLSFPDKVRFSERGDEQKSRDNLFLFADQQQGKKGYSLLENQSPRFSCSRVVEKKEELLSDQEVPEETWDQLRDQYEKVERSCAALVTLYEEEKRGTLAGDQEDEKQFDLLRYHRAKSSLKPRQITVLEKEYKKKLLEKTIKEGVDDSFASEDGLVTEQWDQLEEAGQEWLRAQQELLSEYKKKLHTREIPESFTADWKTKIDEIKNREQILLLEKHSIKVDRALKEALYAQEKLERKEKARTEIVDSKSDRECYQDFIQKNKAVEECYINLINAVQTGLEELPSRSKKDKWEENLYKLAYHRQLNAAKQKEVCLRKAFKKGKLLQQEAENTTPNDLQTFQDAWQNLLLANKEIKQDFQELLHIYQKIEKIVPSEQQEDWKKYISDISIQEKYYELGEFLIKARQAEKIAKDEEDKYHHTLDKGESVSSYQWEHFIQRVRAAKMAYDIFVNHLKSSPENQCMPGENEQQLGYYDLEKAIARQHYYQTREKKLEAELYKSELPRLELEAIDLINVESEEWSHDERWKRLCLTYQSIHECYNQILERYNAILNLNRWGIIEDKVMEAYDHQLSFALKPSFMKLKIAEKRVLEAIMKAQTYSRDELISSFLQSNLLSRLSQLKECLEDFSQQAKQPFEDHGERHVADRQLEREHWIRQASLFQLKQKVWNSITDDLLKHLLGAHQRENTTLTSSLHQMNNELKNVLAEVRQMQHDSCLSEEGLEEELNIKKYFHLVCSYLYHTGQVENHQHADNWLDELLSTEDRYRKDSPEKLKTFWDEKPIRKLLLEKSLAKFRTQFSLVVSELEQDRQKAKAFFPLRGGMYDVARSLFHAERVDAFQQSVAKHIQDASEITQKWSEHVTKHGEDDSEVKKAIQQIKDLCEGWH